MILRTASSSRFRSSLKQIFLTATLALSCVLPHQAHALTRGEKGGTFLLASIMLSMSKDKLGESAFAKKLANLTNTDSHDLVDASVLSTYYWAWSYLYESIGTSSNNPVGRSWAADLRYQATIQPLIQIAATSKIYNKLFKSVPGLTMLACSEPDCQGVCDACEYKHLVRKAPLELGAVVLHEVGTKKISHEIQKSRIRRNHAAALAAAAAVPELSPQELARQQAIRALDGHIGDIPGGQAGDGDCPVCLMSGRPLFSQLCPNLCRESRICQPCTQGIIAAAGDIARACCPACRGVGPSPVIRPVEPLFPAAPRLNFSKQISDKLYHIALWEPFWTMCRQENNFLHRWGLELRKINPLVRAHISCENRHTHSICHQCKLKKIFYIHDWAKYLKRAE